MKASIIIPTKDKISRLKLVLYALAPQIENNHEVIIVMDGCNEFTVEEFYEINLSFKPVLILCKQSVGRAAARNYGIKESSGDILIFLDDDRIPGPDFIKAHIDEHLKRHCIIIGKRMQLVLTEEVISQLGNNYHHFNDQIQNIISAAKPDITWLKNQIYLSNPLSPTPWLAFVTSNLSLRKKDVLDAGMFDENFIGWGWEDTDLGYRLMRKKMKIIKQPLIVNYHIVHAKPKDYQAEELHNFKYFYEKVKGDYLTRLSLMMIRIIRDTGFLFKKIVGNG